MISLALENGLFMFLMGFLFASSLYLVSKIWGKRLWNAKRFVLRLSLCQ